MQNTTQQQKKKPTTKTTTIQFTEELINIGKKVLTSMDRRLTTINESASQIKADRLSLGQDLVDYLAQYGKITSREQAELIKDTLYDTLNWKRLGLPSGGNKGRAKVDPTITKYWSTIFGYLQDSPRNVIKEGTQFTDIREAYTDRGNRKLIRSSKYEISKVINGLYENGDSFTKKEINNLTKTILKVLTDVTNNS